MARQLQTMALVAALIAVAFAGIEIGRRMLDDASYRMTPPQAIAASRNLDEDK